MADLVPLVEGPAGGVPLLAGSRRAQWRFELLDRRDRLVRPLHGVRGTSLTMNVNAAVRLSGGATYTGAPVDWTRHRLRAWYKASARGESLEWPLGTFLVQAPEEALGGASVESVELQLLDTSARLDYLKSSASPWVAHKGSNVVETVRALLDSQSVQHSIEDSPEVFTASMSWKPGTTYRRMVNDMLDVTNFYAVWADPMGVIRSERRRPPSARGVRYVFENDRQGEALVVLPELTRRRTEEVPNRVYLVAESDDPDAMPLVGTATDNNPDSPYSWLSTGVVITHVEENVPGGSQATLDARARERLESLQRVSTVYDYDTLPVPLDGLDVIQLRRQDEGVDVVGVVEKAGLRQTQPHMSISAREVRT